jgi:hypothetical protein
MVEPTIDEHALLYNTIAALNATEPMIARQVYAPNPLPLGFPTAIADEELPSTLLPVEGYHKLAEFWGTMGDDHRLKPAIYLVLTVPVLYAPQPMGGMVTTRITEYRTRDAAGASDVWIEIGGTVRDGNVVVPAGQPQPAVAQAWVVLETLAGARVHVTRSNALGRFAFNQLRVGDYRLRVSTEALGETVRDVHVPSPSGEYDVMF